MSTVKTDAITAVSTNGDLSLDGIGTGGVSIASTLKMTKGGDISSASPLVIDTDGNYFDVTGTTNFAAMTVEEGNFFMLQFDGALTITHGSGIELPGAANLTTAAGDRLICYATAANTVEVMSVETEAAASTGFTLATEQATTSGTAITFGSIPSGTKMIILMISGVSSNGTAGYEVTLGDSGGLETSGYVAGAGKIVGTSVTNVDVTDAFRVQLTSVGANTIFGTVILTLEDSTNFTWMEMGIVGGSDHGAGGSGVTMSDGHKSTSAELTQISFTANGDTFDAGAVNIMYQ
jgi:hypothetical protein